MSWELNWFSFLLGGYLGLGILYTILMSKRAKEENYDLTVVESLSVFFLAPLLTPLWFLQFIGESLAKKKVEK